MLELLAVAENMFAAFFYFLDAFFLRVSACIGAAGLPCRAIRCCRLPVLGIIDGFIDGDEDLLREQGLVT
jgi:hypothetical protein